jgi:hypothetical protein
MTDTPQEVKDKARISTIRLDIDYKTIFLKTYAQYYAAFTRAERLEKRINHGTFVFWLCGLAAERLAQMTRAK